MDIRRHIIHPGGVWERFSLYLKQGGHAAVHREVARSLRLRTPSRGTAAVAGALVS